MLDFLGMNRQLPAYHLRVRWPEARADGVEWWMGTFEELPGCMVQGNSIDEAEAKLWRILPGYLAQLRERGQPVPKPLYAPPPSIEGVTVVMAPAGIQSRPGDPSITAPTASSPEELRTAAARPDAVLLGS